MSSPNAQTPCITLFTRDNQPLSREITGDVFSIGRGPDNDLQIKDLLISRNHAEIVRLADGTFLFRDKESKSGSFINGAMVTEKPLVSGDEIILGDITAARIVFSWASASVVNQAEDSRQSVSNILTAPTRAQKVLVPEMAGATIITDRQTRFLNTELMLQPQYVSTRTLQRMASLYEITHKILPVHDPMELVSMWLDCIFKALPVEHGVILIYNPASGQLETAINRDRGNTGALTTFSKTIVEKTFLENVAILASDASADERFSARESIIIQNIRSVLSAPISSKSRVWGVCYLYSRTQAALFDSEDLEFLMATAREVGLVMENLSLINELRATQEQLVKSERMAAIGKLASSISHELRNRLALLSGAEILEIKYGNDPEVKQFTDMVLLGQERALALVEEIRAYAKNRPMDFEKIRRPIVPTIERTISFLRLDQGVKRRALHFQFTESPELVFNEEKVEQVLMNLVRNAVEATKEDTGQVMVRLVVEGSTVAIHVADNGCGIPAENLQRIWEPFFTTKGDEGTGLGLDICRRIIEAHGGTIICQSQVGVGTCFTIRLPL